MNSDHTAIVETTRPRVVRGDRPVLAHDAWGRGRPRPRYRCCDCGDDTPSCRSGRQTRLGTRRLGTRAPSPAV